MFQVFKSHGFPPYRFSRVKFLITRPCSWIFRELQGCKVQRSLEARTDVRRVGAKRKNTPPGLALFSNVSSTGRVYIKNVIQLVEGFAFEHSSIYVSCVWLRQTPVRLAVGPSVRLSIRSPVLRLVRSFNPGCLPPRAPPGAQESRADRRRKPGKEFMNIMVFKLNDAARKKGVYFDTASKPASHPPTFVYDACRNCRFVDSTPGDCRGGVEK